MGLRGWDSQGAPGLFFAGNFCKTRRKRGTFYLARNLENRNTDSCDMNIKFPIPEAQDAVLAICRMARQNNGRAFLVGGCVRDALLGLAVKDFDLEVYGIPSERLIALLSESFPLDLVGQAFVVVKLKGLPVDVSLPRRESKQGLGHKGFHIASDPDLAPAVAAARRDFTINAIMHDPLTGEIQDPFNGRADLEKNILRHVSGQFVEDPLRVLRAMQFIARFRLQPAPETVALCRAITPESLPRERIGDEWTKLILRGHAIGDGLRFLKDVGWLAYYPELQTMVDCAQEPEWHPEGDVWDHTLYCMDAFAADRINDEWEDRVVGFAVLCHDLGKPATTRFEDGRLRSKNHDVAGEAPSRSFMARLTAEQRLVDEAVALVTTHLRPMELYNSKAGDSAIRRLAAKVVRIDRLVRVALADQKGRPPIPFEGFLAGDWLLDRARVLEIRNQAPRPLVLGRHLIEMGKKPGPHFKAILGQCYEAQLDGEFTTLEDGLAFCRQLFSR